MLVGLFALGPAGIYALGDVGTLRRDRVEDQHPVSVKDVVLVRVADVADGLAGDGVVIQHRLGRDLAADHHQVALGVGFTGNAAGRVLGQAGIQHRIRNGVAHFVRVALANGLGRKDVVFAHGIKPNKPRLRCRTKASY